MLKRGLVLAAIAGSLVWAAQAGAASCGYPGAEWQSKPPEQLGMDGQRLQDAFDWTLCHATVSIAVYRHGCLAGQGRLDSATSGVAWDGWSMTKSVTAMLLGRASRLGKVDIRKPIAPLYPEADAAHAQLTPLDLLTMTSGLHRNFVRDLSPQPDNVRDALALPFDHEPGTYWEYQQSGVTLVLNAMERAVGEDAQKFAQDQLFGPIGIAPGDGWSWERDRAGHTQGWAHLHMKNGDWARFGLLLLRKGRWGSRRLLSRAYVEKMTTPGKVNNAYGLLTWLNGGGRYVMPAVQGYDSGEGQLVPAGPRDMFLFAGQAEQRLYVIPSRDMVIVRLGENGSQDADTRTSVWTGHGGQLDHEIVRRVLRAVTDVPYDDPGPYAGSDPHVPPADDGVIGDALEPDDVAAGIGAGPSAPAGCSPVGCD
jgi:CubicO group peptidase (beta-lactamase class C family)